MYMPHIKFLHKRFSSFSAAKKCYGQTDGQTDGQAQTSMPPQLLRSWWHKNHFWQNAKNACITIDMLSTTAVYNDICYIRYLHHCADCWRSWGRGGGGGGGGGGRELGRDAREGTKGAQNMNLPQEKNEYLFLLYFQTAWFSHFACAESFFHTPQFICSKCSKTVDRVSTIRGLYRNILPKIFKGAQYLIPILIIKTNK